MNLLIDVMPNEILHLEGDYKDAKELWEKVVNLPKNPLSAKKNKNEKDSLNQEERNSKVEESSTFTRRLRNHPFLVLVVKKNKDPLNFQSQSQ